MSEGMQIAVLIVSTVAFIAVLIATFAGSDQGRDVSMYATWKQGRLAALEARNAHAEKMEAMKLEHERAIAKMQLQPFETTVTEYAPARLESVPAKKGG